MAEPEASVCKPGACLRVGVTGHRTGDKLPAEVEPLVRRTVDSLLLAMKTALDEAVADDRAAFAAREPELVVISSLAEGADRIVAEAGLAASAALDVVLPKPRAAYEGDFATEASKAEFRDLLGRARTVFELAQPQDALAEKRGYETAGLIMLAQTDILLAIWDRGEAAGIGGTAEIIEQAIAEGAPVLAINPQTPGRADLLWTGDLELPPGRVRLEEIARAEGVASLPRVIGSLVAPPDDPVARGGLAELYREPPGPEHGWPIYSAFLALLGVRRLRRTDFVPLDKHPFSTESWRASFPGVGKPLEDAVCNTLLPAITLPDRFAVRYAELYRSAFVFNFLAAAVTVVLAVSGLAAESSLFHGDAGMALKLWLVLGEIVLLFSIVGVWLWGARRAWHRRWLDYRRMSEWLRYLRVLCLVGARSAIGRPRPRPVSRNEFGRRGRLEQDDWVGWYVRSTERSLPLPMRVVDQDYLDAVRKAVCTTELDGQINYHRTNHERMAAAAHRLHWAGLVLFGLPIASGLLFVAAYAEYRPWLHAYRFWFTAAAAALPALAAALNAIRIQADFETVAGRSKDAADHLTRIREALGREPLTFARLSDRIERAIAVMGAEHSEWRTLFGTRPLGLSV